MRTRSGTSPSTTSPRCRSRPTGWTSATCSTRPRSRRSSSAGWRAPSVLRRIRAEVARGLRVTVDGRPAALRAVAPPRLALRPGAGGLRTTRFELALRAPARDARRVVLRDDTFRDRVGWRAIVAKPGRGTAVRTGAPATDPTRRLTRYPAALLEQPRRPARGAPRRAPGRRHARRRRRAQERGGRERGGRVRRAVRRRRGRRGRAAPAPAGRVRVGRRARALPRAREGDGRGLPRRHARDGAAGGRARRDGHRHPHRGRRAARRGRADAVAVRAPRGPVSVAEPRRRAARAGRRRGGAARPARRGAITRITITTTTTSHATRRPSGCRRAGSWRWAPPPG